MCHTQHASCHKQQPPQQQQQLAATSRMVQQVLPQRACKTELRLPSGLLRLGAGVAGANAVYACPSIDLTGAASRGGRTFGLEAVGGYIIILYMMLLEGGVGVCEPCRPRAGLSIGSSTAGVLCRFIRIIRVVAPSCN